MILCNKDCTPCCDFCIYAIHEEFEENGKLIKGGLLDVKSILMRNIRKLQRAVDIAAIIIVAVWITSRKKRTPTLNCGLEFFLL